MMRNTVLPPRAKLAGGGRSLVVQGPEGFMLPDDDADLGGWVVGVNRNGAESWLCPDLCP
jgi:hypothetical protein